jgi:glutaredoxin 2
METLYVYDHCPFCVKARMIFGLKNISFDLKYLANDDEQTPTSMIGKKILPILKDDDGFMGESMDIVRKIDARYGESILKGDTNPFLVEWINEVCYTYGLVIPRTVLAGLPEFATESSRNYYLATKKKMDFYWNTSELLAQTDAFLDRINNDLLKLVPIIKQKGTCNDLISEDDFLLFPILRGLSLVKGIVYPSVVDEYRKAMSFNSGVPLFKENL